MALLCFSTRHATLVNLKQSTSCLLWFLFLCLKPHFLSNQRASQCYWQCITTSEAVAIGSSSSIWRTPPSKAKKLKDLLAAAVIKFLLVFTAPTSRTVRPGQSSHHLLGLVRVWHLWSSLRGRLYFERYRSVVYWTWDITELPYNVINAVYETSPDQTAGGISSMATCHWTYVMQTAFSFSSDHFIQSNVNMYIQI